MNYTIRQISPEMAKLLKPLTDSERVAVFARRLGEGPHASFHLDDKCGDLNRDPKTGNLSLAVRYHKDGRVEMYHYDQAGKFIPTPESTSFSGDCAKKLGGDILLKQL